MPSLIKKITSTPKGWSTKPKERLSYYLYFCGQNAIYNLVASFLTTYLMLSIGGLVKTAGIMLAVKVWDAVNDAIFGVLFDKVKFKSGKKFVPWLKISLVFIPLTTVMLFAIPNNFSENAKLIWLAVSYILWDTAYTLCDVPIFGIITSMSENIDERNSIISYKQIWAGVGSGVALILGTVLVGEHFGKMFQILVVGSDDSECSFLVETFQDGFGNSASNLRFRTSTELVNQDEAPFVTALHHDFHIGQVRRVGTQIIFNRLLITNIDKDATEYTGMTTFVQGNQHAALQHILQQTDCFQTDGLTSGIRSGYNKDTLFLIELYIQWYNFLSMFG